MFWKFDTLWGLDQVKFSCKFIRCVFLFWRGAMKLNHFLSFSVSISSISLLSSCSYVKRTLETVPFTWDTILQSSIHCAMSWKWRLFIMEQSHNQTFSIYQYRTIEDIHNIHTHTHWTNIQKKSTSIFLDWRQWLTDFIHYDQLHKAIASPNPKLCPPNVVERIYYTLEWHLINLNCKACTNSNNKKIETSDQ